MTEWQSIESAPKDGSLVLAWREDWDQPAFVRWSENRRTKTTFWNDHVEQDHYENESEPPTHWLKLPPLPIYYNPVIKSPQVPEALPSSVSHSPAK